ncbi:MAG TPA: amino acid ABC transporter permease [Stellaceae bacterium]|jgi:polar amino acid transport system permease protein|nr:amino acid ABC transporter permease [Stellaceae bacterium]
MNHVAYSWDFSFLWHYRWLIVWGLGVTIAYTIATIVIGIVIGLAVGLLRLSSNRLVTLPLIAYVEVFRCTPLLVQIIWFYYAFPVVIGIDIPGIIAAGLVLSLYTGAFYAEIVRGGVNSIERGQWDAARSIGLHYVQMMRLVILPQAFRRMIPPFMNQSIIQLKNTSLVSTIAVADLLYQGQMITAATYRPLEVYTMIAVLYFIVLFPLTLGAQEIERRLARKDLTPAARRRNWLFSRRGHLHAGRAGQAPIDARPL